jgi:hypothetical protein
LLQITENRFRQANLPNFVCINMNASSFPFNDLPFTRKFVKRHSSFLIADTIGGFGRSRREISQRLLDCRFIERTDLVRLDDRAVAILRLSLHRALRSHVLYPRSSAGPDFSASSDNDQEQLRG